MRRSTLCCVRWFFAAACFCACALFVCCPLEKPAGPDASALGFVEPGFDFAAWRASGSVHEYYVSPSGSAGNAGTEASPWDLYSVARGDMNIPPDSLIWLGEGSYAPLEKITVKLRGQAGRPIVLRAALGKRVTIDGKNLTGSIFWTESEYVYYWGMELCDTSTRAHERPLALNIRGGEGNRFINLIIHNTAGMGWWHAAGNNQFYGCLSIYNGDNVTDEPGEGTPISVRQAQHHLYTQNADISKPKYITDNIFIQGFGYGIYLNASHENLHGYHIKGNVWFGAGAANKDPDYIVSNLLISSNAGRPVDGILIEENMGWAPEGAGRKGRSVQLGRRAELSYRIALRGNYLVGSTQFYNRWESIDMRGNTFYTFLPAEGTPVEPSAYPDNSFLSAGAPPAANKIFVRPNAYEKKRGHIIVYNWEGLASVAVDVSAILAAGDSFTVRNAEHYYGAPVLAGSYPGGMLAIPMDGLAIEQPIGRGEVTSAEQPGKRFKVFIVEGS